ncbi:DNA repair protein RadA [Acutalibacter muris]|uniref:DNA repair protein RadA n=1 Tax=Acutalibacter muris TaxID=1796620 RepID=A0A1Z2XQU2_9FIRM|nr:DNA repair protein RadA [Acutalibacter muris]ANU52562.1 DNA repair protein RadA [Hungateiclostridiaceae bacterium KB18]ASB40771.1 DNA repair protein RadA [Acutalibacter muris]QQR30052.1 DNA repair protein RadA [Acutalibacter muris]
MAGKIKLVYQCTQCGFESPKWAGKCPGCGEWNTMLEAAKEPVSSQRTAVVRSLGNVSRPMPISDISTTDEHRYTTGLSELDRVLGGGIVKGSLVLIGGDPGIGKSTMLLQICEYLGQGLRIMYVSGEESARQIKLRATRLGVQSPNLLVLTETDVQYVVEQIRSERPDLVMVDSIQTMNHTELTSSPGSVTQVRECTNTMMRCAKTLDIPVIIVGHVNKDGAIAGPKVLEHIVDAVLLFEGDRQMTYRILRAVKNRYGSTNEIGVFDMGDHGLQQVENPSLAMLSGRPKDSSGTCVTAVMEGTRPLLAEIQGLATTSGFGTPRRMSTGFDHNRLALILAVLEKRAGYYFSNLDTYINVVGGLRLDEPAVDLAIALALISSLKDTPIREDTVVFGEIGLAGELRSISHSDLRISEAGRLGFARCILPYHGLKNLAGKTYDGIEVIGAKNIRQAFEAAT